MKRTNKYISAKSRAFLTYYFGEAARNATEAARLAGYSHPMQASYHIKKRLAEEIAAKELEIEESSMMKAKDIVAALEKESKEADAPRDRIRALEILAKIAGLEKVDIKIDRGELVRAVRDNLALVVKDATIAPKPLIPQPQISNVHAKLAN